MRPLRVVIDDVAAIAKQLKQTAQPLMGSEVREFGKRLDQLIMELHASAIPAAPREGDDPNVRVGFIYDIKFVASDYTTKRPMWVVTDPAQIARYREKLAGRPEGWAPERPILVREEVGPLGGT